MSNVPIKSGSQLPPMTTPNLSMGAYVINPADNVTYYVPWTSIAAMLGVSLSSSDIVGTALTNTVPIATGFVRYLVSVAGTYTNFKDASNAAIVVSSADVTGGYVELWGTNNVWEKHVISINLSAYALSGGSAKTLQQIDNEKVATSYLIEQTKNLFNKDATTSTTPQLKTGTFKDGGNGAESTNASFAVYGPISLTNGQSIASSIDGVIGGNGRLRSVSVYNASNVFIGGGTNTAANTFTMAAATASYVYVCLFTDGVTTGKLQIERGTTATFFESYGDRVKNTLIKLFDGQVTAIGDKYYRKIGTQIKVDEVTFIQQTVNLFNKDATTLTTPQLIPNTSRDGTNGVDATNATYSVYGPIPLTVGQSIVSSVAGNTGGTTVLRTVAVYNAAGTFIGGGTNTISNTFTMGAATGASVYVTLYNTGIASGGLQIQRGTTITAYEGYGRYLIEDIVGFKNAASTPVASLKWTTMGDSITIQQQWQPIVLAKLSLVLTNVGIGGTKMSGSNSDSMWQDARVTTIPVDTQILNTMAGANDWAQNKALGTIDSVDTDTYMGAYNVYMGKVFARIPFAQMFIMGVTFAIHPPSGDAGWISATKNQLGLTTKDYSNAAKLIADKWNVTFIDTDDLCWNETNYTHYLVDDSMGASFVHPNSTYGGPSVAREVIEGMIHRIR